MRPKKKKTTSDNKRSFTKKTHFSKRDRPATNLPRVEVIGMRLNKYIAHAGVCSRRQAADLVKAGKITVNSEIEINPAYQIQEGDKVSYLGKLLKPEENRVYILMNKPKNVLTTLSDDRGRKTVMDVIGTKVSERIFPVGRLDRNTTGLLLMTNDGELSKKLMHPSHKVKKVYIATLDKKLEEAHLETIKAGFDLEDGHVKVDGIGYMPDGKQKDIGVTIHIGRNRIVRRIFEHFGYQVVKLDRTYLGGLTKKDLPRGKFRDLSESEIVMLKHFT